MSTLRHSPPEPARLVRITCASALFVLLTACGDAGNGGAASGSTTPTQSAKQAASQTKPATSASGKVAEPAPPSTGTAAPVANNDEGLTPADYEEEAEKAITLDNLDAELAKIEAEIHAK